MTRLVAKPMSKELGQEIVVKNAEGAGGTLAAGDVAEAEPDGYTLLMHHIGMSTAPALYPDLAFDPLKDFKTIGLVTTVPMTIVSNKDFEPNNLEELVTYVKANADKVTLANAGVGAASHLCGLLIEQAVGVDLNEVPYDGTGPALTDLVGGQVDFLCDQTTNTIPQIEGDKVKAFAVTTPERIEALPDLQTTAEAGLPDVEVGVWHGLYAPAETPDEVVKAVTDALAKALKDPEVVKKMADLGTEPVPEDQVTPDAHTKLLGSRSTSGRPSSRTPASRGHDGGIDALGSVGRADGASTGRRPSSTTWWREASSSRWAWRSRSARLATSWAPRSGWGPATCRSSSVACWHSWGSV